MPVGRPDPLGSIASAGDTSASESPQIAENRFDEDRLVGAGGFEPPKHEHPHQQTPHTQHLADALTDRLNQAVDVAAETTDRRPA